MSNSASMFNISIQIDNEGRCHCEDGPAVIGANGRETWYYHGKEIPVFNLKDFQAYIRNKAFW